MIADLIKLSSFLGSKWRQSFVVLAITSVLVSMIDAVSVVVFALASKNIEIVIFQTEISKELAAIYFILFSAIIRGFLQYLQIKFSFLSAVTLGKKIFSLYLLRSKLKSEEIKDNRIISTITARLNTISGNIILSSLQILNFSSFLIILLYFLLYFQVYQILLALIFLVTVFALILFIIKPFTKKLGSKINSANTQIVETLNETTQIWQLIRVRMQEHNVINNYSNLETEFRRNMANVGFLTSLPRFGVEIILAFCLGLVLLFGSSSNDFDPMTIVVFGYAALRAIPMVQQGYNGITLMMSGYAGLKEVLEIVADFKLVQFNNSKGKKRISDIQKIEVRNLKSTRIAISGQKPVSFEIHNGDKIVIIGDSGTGKSTLLDSIMGLVDVNDDTILYNDRCVNTINLTSIYKQVSYLPQVAPLINGTVRDNMLFGVGANYDTKIFKELLLLMNFTNQNGGVDEEFLSRDVGDRGKNLSGGQRQRIQLINTLITGKKILILDEATSALDETMETEVIRYLTSRVNTTLLVITHNKNLKQYFYNQIDLN